MRSDRLVGMDDHHRRSSAATCTDWPTSPAGIEKRADPSRTVVVKVRDGRISNRPGRHRR